MCRSVFLASICHLLTNASVFEKISLQTPEEPVEQVVRLVDQANSEIRDDLWRASFADLSYFAVGEIRIPSEFTDLYRFPGSLVPKRATVCAKKVLVVSEQFFEAGPCDVREL
jgi:hypothetical protein